MNLELKSFFGFTGKIGRLEYFVKGILTSIPALILSGVSFFLQDNVVVGSLLALVSLVVFIVTVVSLLSLIKRRMNDLELSTWLIVLILIPLVNFFYSLYLIFAPGKGARTSQPAQEETTPPPTNESEGLYPNLDQDTPSEDPTI